MSEYVTLKITSEFLERFGDKRFSAQDRRRFLQALRLLDTNEGHPSLRVHLLKGNLQGYWSVSASDELRITFTRDEEGVKVLWECTRHYND